MFALLIEPLAVQCAGLTGQNQASDRTSKMHKSGLLLCMICVARVQQQFISYTIQLTNPYAAGLRTCTLSVDLRYPGIMPFMTQAKEK